MGCSTKPKARLGGSKAKAQTRSGGLQKAERCTEVRHKRPSEGDGGDGELVRLRLPRLLLDSEAEASAEGKVAEKRRRGRSRRCIGDSGRQQRPWSERSV